LNQEYISKINKKHIVFKMGEIFSGPGGLALGASLAEAESDNYNMRIQHVWAIDNDKDSCRTFEYNLSKRNECKVICRDIAKQDFSELTPIDCLAFGFPCNDFSVVGEKKGINGHYGPLYRNGVKALEHFKPLWFIAENVSGLRNSNDGQIYKQILTELREAGYNVFPQLYKFEEYGIPQNRHRIIIIGIRRDLDFEFRCPVPNGVRKSAREAIETPPIDMHASNHELTLQSAQVIERLRYIKPGENAFTAEMPEELRLKVKGASISQIYKRLNPDKPAYTITGSGGGGTHVYHWAENRALTNRERARLQTFPDDFIFAGSKESVRKQIGMAVPPIGAKIIFESILNAFIKNPYKWQNRLLIENEESLFNIEIGVNYVFA